MTKTFAIIPVETWRAIRYEQALALLAELTADGNDPQKVTATLGKINEYNAVNQIVVYEDRPVNP